MNQEERIHLWKEHFKNLLKNPPIAKNYRGITLTSTAAKIYHALLLKRTEPEIDKILRQNQNGFRRN